MSICFIDNFAESLFKWHYAHRKYKKRILKKIVKKLNKQSLEADKDYYNIATVTLRRLKWKLRATAKVKKRINRKMVRHYAK